MNTIPCKKCKGSGIIARFVPSYYGGYTKYTKCECRRTGANTK